jgi:hypothetical protein
VHHDRNEKNNIVNSNFIDFKLLQNQQLNVQQIPLKRVKAKRIVPHWQFQDFPLDSRFFAKTLRLHPDLRRHRGHDLPRQKSESDSVMKYRSETCSAELSSADSFCKVKIFTMLVSLNFDHATLLALCGVNRNFHYVAI